MGKVACNSGGDHPVVSLRPRSAVNVRSGVDLSRYAVDGGRDANLPAEAPAGARSGGVAAASSGVTRVA